MGFLDTIASFPTVIFTLMLGVSLVYWLFVIVGAVDLDGHHGSADGALDGAMHHGAAHHGGHDGLAEAAADASHGFDFMSALRLREAPLTVVISLFSILGWVLSSLTMSTFGGTFASWGLPTWLLGLPVFLIVSIIALLGTSVLTRPLGRLFVTHKAAGNKDLIGKVVVISTGRVSPTFGQAMLHDGGAGLIMQVRGDHVGLKKGERALIIGYDEKAGGFQIEPMNDLLGDARGAASQVRGSNDAELLAEAEAEAEAALAEPGAKAAVRRAD